jgi:REP element-mobilizing transposase RayT
MPRQLRVEYAGAIYHVMSRANGKGNIFEGDVDRHDFIKTLAEACGKTGFEVHAYCLMRNHFHLVVEIPKANLVAGMRWLLGKTSALDRSGSEEARKERAGEAGDGRPAAEGNHAVDSGDCEPTAPWGVGKVPVPEYTIGESRRNPTNEAKL